MKKNVTYVDAAKFEAIIKESGLDMTGQKGFVKVQGPAGHCVYVAATKNVGRVDISGFEVLGTDLKPLPGFVEPHCGVFGNVRQQLDFSKTEDEILTNFKFLLAELAKQESKAKKERKPTAAKKDAPQGWSKGAARKEAIAKKAKQKAEGKGDGAIVA